MRFTVAAAMMATGAMAHSAVSTDYTTQLVTVTNCPPEVPDCPAHSKTTAVTSTVLPLTTSTVYSTQVHTITSCPPNVVKCPSHSTVYSTETIAVSTTVCPVGPPAAPTHPVYGNGTTVVGCHGPECPPKATVTPTKPAPVPVYSCPAGEKCKETEKVPHGPGETKPAAPPAKSSAAPGVPSAPACKTASVTAITRSYTTVLTTVEYSTVEVACPTGPGKQTGVNPPAPTNPAGGCHGPECPAVPTGTKPTGGNGSGCTGANCTSPTGVPPVVAGAASFTGSAFFAVAAGVAAYVFA